MRLDVLIFTNEQAWLREAGRDGEDGEDGEEGEDGEAGRDGGDGEDCVGAGFTTNVSFSP